MDDVFYINLIKNMFVVKKQDKDNLIEINKLDQILNQWVHKLEEINKKNM